jgi:hypothetical protein
MEKDARGRKEAAKEASERENMNPIGEENLMKRRTAVFLACLTAFLLLGMSVAVSPAAEEAPRMTIEDLKERMGSPDLVILDLRYGIGWTLSTQKIKGALREDPEEKTGEWAGKYGKDKTIVTYCT